MLLNNRIRRFLDSECFSNTSNPVSIITTPKKKKYPPYTWFKYPPRDQIWADLFVGICYSSQVCVCLVVLNCNSMHALRIMYLGFRVLGFLSKDARHWEKYWGHERNQGFRVYGFRVYSLGLG
jgi:hypothetical protein